MYPILSTTSSTHPVTKLGTDPLITKLGPAVLTYILSFADVSSTAKRVSKNWYTSSFRSQYALAISYISHPELSIIVSRVAPDVTSPTVKESPKIVRDTHTAIKKIKDENFLDFFNRLNEEIPQERRPQIAKELALQEKVTLLRSWMRENQDILNTIDNLNLSNFGLVVLPDEVGLLIYLRILKLNVNQMTTFPAAISQLIQLQELTRLQELSLCDNQLTTFPAVICQLTQLQVLFLSHNRLTTLPAKFAQLKRLKNLHLFNNPLTTFPDAICQLTQLQDLGLSSTQLTTLPAKFAQLKRLKNLHLFNNQLTTFPDAICQLTRLKKLDISYNQLTTLPVQISQLIHLKILILHDNQLRNLPIEVEQFFQYLRTNESELVL